MVAETKNQRIDELLAFLPPLFRKGDLDTCLRKGNYSAQVLYRALKKGLIARIAVPERALLDWIHVRRPSEYLLRSWVDEMDLESVDPAKLKDFSAHYPPRVRRLGKKVLQLGEQG